MTTNKKSNDFVAASFRNWIEEVSKSTAPIDAEKVIHDLRANRETGIFFPSNTLLGCLSALGKLVNNPKTAVDPYSGIGLVLSKCDYVDKRIGYEKNVTVANLAAKLFTNIDFRVGDFKSIGKGKYDLVVSAPPLVPHELSEFLISSLNFLNKDGLLVLAISQNVLTAPLFENFRSKVLGEFALDMIVFIPQGAAFISTMIPMAVMVIRNGKPNETTLLADLEGKSIDEIIENFKNGNGEYQVSRSDLNKRWDRNFHDPKFKKIDEYLSKFEVKRVDELAEVLRGYAAGRDTETQGDYPLISPRNIQAGELVIDDRTKKIAPTGRRVVITREGDLLISLIGQPKFYIISTEDPAVIPNQNFAIIRSNNNKYIATFLRTEEGVSLFQEQMDRKSRGAGIRFHSIADLRAIKIPIFEIDDLNRLSDEEINSSSKETLEKLRLEVGKLSEGFSSYPAHTISESPAIYTASQGSFQIAVSESQNWFGAVTFLSQQLNKIEIRLSRMEQKIDKILTLITEMQSRLKEIKNLQREDEEKIILMMSQINEFSDKITQEQKDLSQYELIIRRWLERYPILEVNSKTYLSTAEFIFDQIDSIGSTANDFSPFVLQYSRALESEFLKKMFEKYQSDLKERNTDIPNLVAGDLRDKTKAEKFAKKIKSNASDFALGDMHFVLGLLKEDGSTYKSSLLLQDFRKFILQNFQEFIISQEFLKEIKTVVDDYRNKAAHPYILDIQNAEDCKKLIRKLLNQLLDNFIPITSSNL
jgi:hypothetical protein